MIGHPHTGKKILSLVYDENQKEMPKLKIIDRNFYVRRAQFKLTKWNELLMTVFGRALQPALHLDSGMS